MSEISPQAAEQHDAAYHWMGAAKLATARAGAAAAREVLQIVGGRGHTEACRWSATTATPG